MDLFICANHLFVAAMAGIVLAVANDEKWQRWGEQI
jgi:hypothetical protein